MTKGNWKLALLVMTVAVAVCAAGMLVNANGCVTDYNDVVVSGAGSDNMNGTYEYGGMSGDRPVFSGPGPALISWILGHWVMADDNFGYYYVQSDDATPPSSGWYSVNIDLEPLPTVSGGEEIPCGGAEEKPALIVIPTGDGGPDSFLDALLPLAEGEVAPMIGLQPLAAVHAVGDVVTGSCQILNSSDLPTGASYVHIYTYSVDVSAHPESVVLLDHWMASYNHSTQEFEIAWDTSGLAPGYYDLYLSFADGSSELMRIQLVAAPV
jgi:hypothetical protein